MDTLMSDLDIRQARLNVKRNLEEALRLRDLYTQNYADLSAATSTIHTILRAQGATGELGNVVSLLHEEERRLELGKVEWTAKADVLTRIARSLKIEGVEA